MSAVGRRDAVLTVSGVQGVAASLPCLDLCLLRPKFRRNECEVSTFFG